MSRIFPVERALALLAAGGLAAGLALAQTAQTAAGSRDAMKDTIVKLENELAAKYGEAERPRIRRGIDQAAEFWRSSDGDAAAFADVVRKYVTPDSEARNALYSRLEFALESIDGHMVEISRDLRRQSDLDLGQIYPFDETMAGYDPAAHINDDFFQNQLAFAVLLNFPITTLAAAARPGRAVVAPPVGRGAAGRALLQAHPRRRQPRDRGRRRPRRSATSPSTTSGCTTSSTTRESGCSRRRCACSPTGTCATRSRPTTRRQGRAREAARDRPGDGPHRHADDSRRGHRQPARRLEPVHERGQARRTRRTRTASEAEGGAASNAPEPDTRYAVLLKRFQAARKADPYSPTAPTLIARRFEREPADPGGAGPQDARGRSSPRRSCRASRLSSRAASAVRSSRSTSGTTASSRAGSTPRSSSTRSSARSTPPRGVRGGHPAACSSARLHAGQGEVPREPHRRRPGARLRPRSRRRAPRATSPTCARASRRTG